MHRIRQQLDDMTAMAKPELERYNRQRVRAWQEILVKMAETEVSCVYCKVNCKQCRRNLEKNRPKYDVICKISGLQQLLLKNESKI